MDLICSSGMDQVCRLEGQALSLEEAMTRMQKFLGNLWERQNNELLFNLPHA